MMSMQALEVQITGAFAEHEAKLGQQQEALARQSQKGLATMQARINALQATVAADSAEHAAAYADLQRHNERLQRDKESAYAKGDPSFSVRHIPSTTCICLFFAHALTSSGRSHS
jgi:molecular chaperone GrpE (heat shock protein)